jgi:hypothetical protein
LVLDYDKHETEFESEEIETGAKLKDFDLPIKSDIKAINELKYLHAKGKDIWIDNDRVGLAEEIIYNVPTKSEMIVKKKEDLYMIPYARPWLCDLGFSGGNKKAFKSILMNSVNIEPFRWGETMKFVMLNLKYCRKVDHNPCINKKIKARQEVV